MGSLEDIQLKNFNPSKNILVIGGSVDSTLLCSLLRKNKHRIIVVDINPNCPAKDYCDQFINISTYDFKGQIEILKKYKIDYCITRCNGIPARNTFQLNELIKNNKNSNLAEDLLNKLNLAAFCQQNMINYPKTIAAGEYVKDLKINFPFILKPIYEIEGKKTTFKILDANKINRRLIESNKNSSLNQSVFQEYLEGEDLSILGYVRNNEYFELDILKEENNFNGDKLQHHGFASVESKYSEQLYKIAKKISSKIKIPLTPLNMGFKISKGEIFLLECNLDFGGEKVLENIVSSKKESLLNDFFVKLGQLK